MAKIHLKDLDKYSNEEFDRDRKSNYVPIKSKKDKNKIKTQKDLQ